MELANYIETAMKSILKNPIYEVLSEIKITKILKQSNFVKREVGYPPFQIILHFLYMLIMQKRQSTFIKNSDKAYGKDVYYRFIKEKRYNWRKLLLLSATEILKKIKPLHKNGEYRLLIIDDTVEPKRGKFIEGTCKYIWSNKEHRSINALNIVSLNYADSHSTFQLDFSIKMNDSKRKSTSEFTAKLHHRSNAYQRKSEIIKGKNMLALEMLERALDNGIDADYLLVDSWYAKPNFIKEANTLGMPVIARLPNNKLIWNFKGKYKTLNAIYDSFKNIRHKYSGKHGKISYKYFDSVLEHAVLGKVKLVFLHTGKDLLVFISTDISISGKEILETYKKRWNIEQGYKDLRLLFGLGKEENRIYEALIGKITLSMFTYNIVSYINRIKHEPQTLGELFRDLECELETLAISMQLFIQILTKISEIQNVVKDNKDLLQIIAVISAFTQKELGFMCESWDIKTFDNLTASFKTKIGTLDRDLPIFKHFFAGGAYSNRGYAYEKVGVKDSDDNPYGGLSMIDSSLEFEYNIYKNIGVVTFFDSTMLSLESNNFNDKFYNSFGFGARYYTPIGPFRVDFGFPKDDGGFVFHIGIGQVFW